MMSSFNPVRECWIDFMYFAANATTSSVAPLHNFVGPITVVPLVGTGLAGTRNVTFESAAESTSVVGTPDAGTWAAINQGGFCSEAAALSLAFTTAGEPYATDDQEARRAVLQCPGAFLRAKVDTYDAAILAVMVIGKARKLDQI